MSKQSISSTSSTDEKIYIHVSKCIINENTYIYSKDVLNLIKIGSCLRISYELNSEEEYIWRYDAPYVKVIMINNSELLGEIQDINRISNNRYPLNIGEKIWFKKENVIEIPTSENAKCFKEMLTTDTVPSTGPLFTIESDYSDSSSESRSDSSSVSDSD